MPQPGGSSSNPGYPPYPVQTGGGAFPPYPTSNFGGFPAYPGSSGSSNSAGYPSYPMPNPSGYNNFYGGGGGGVPASGAVSQVYLKKNNPLPNQSNNRQKCKFSAIEHIIPRWHYDHNRRAHQSITA